MNFPGAGAAGPAPGGMDPNDPNMKRMQAVMDSCFAKTAMSGVAGFALGGVFGLFMASMAYDTPYHTPVPTTSTPAANAAAAGGKAAASLATTSTTGAAATTAGTAAAGTAGKTAIGSGVAAPTTVTTAATNAATTSTVASTSAASTTATSTSTTAAAVPKPAATLATAAPKPALAGVAGAGSSVAAAAAYVEPPSIPLRQQLATGFRDMGTRSYSSAKNFGTVGALFAGIECGIEGLRAKNDMGNGVAAGCLTGAILARNAGPQAAAIGCAGFAAFSAAIDAYLRMPPGDD
ncbi:Mitochondrial import inner membrane translocase subunit tim22 [Sporothrix stenoceras]|uniref:Mitochondrial import inner membrane translocase subunit TIM22 n=1 Tax=Sporothrix stenoceras TaxID=5173 RepID=A0ABR3Z788_9PEZI